jgi:lauroyl/myristoyl acyltransferase
LGAARGAIVLTAHMGNYDLGAALFAEKFHREIRMVRAPEADPETAQHLSASLEKAGAVKIDYNTAGALLSFDLLKALRDGEIVSIQGDRVEGKVAQTTARLFDSEVRLPNGPFVLSLVVVREPIQTLRSGGDRQEDIEKAVAQWCAVLEEILAQFWDQWFAFTPIFPAR